MTKDIIALYFPLYLDLQLKDLQCHLCEASIVRSINLPISLRPPGFDFPTPPRQIKNVLVRTLLAQIPQGLLKLVQVISVLSAWPTALHDLLRQRLRILRTQELRVVRQTDIYETLDRVRDVG